MRKTKIICTMGPACSDEKTIEEMCNAGMNVARLNFSHETHEKHFETIEMIKKVRNRLKLPIAILLDTKGPEFRIGTFKSGKITLKEGDLFTFTSDEDEGSEDKVSINCKGIIDELKPDDIILVNNGLVALKVIKTDKANAFCTVLIGGILSDKKSMSFPGKHLKQTYLSERDKSDILFGIENGVDFIACSFVSSKKDLLDVKDFLNNNGGDDIELIAKIENRSGIDNIEEICEECSGIMIGRGDMGVEIPFEEVPAIQKQLITKCRLLGKRVITATEMLESMIINPRPTRAEISDVANAVYDGTSAVMLSGETAAGNQPVLTVATMAKIVENTEKNIHYAKRFANTEFKIKNTADAVSHATCGMAIDIGASVIAVCSISGITARMVSRFRPPVDILGITTNEKTWRKLALSWGVTPVIADTFSSADVMFAAAKRLTKEKMNLNPGEKIVITGGAANGIPGNTDTIKVVTLSPLN